MHDAEEKVSAPAGTELYTELLVCLEVAVFDVAGDGTPLLVSDPPGWLAELVPGCARGRPLPDLVTRFPFVDNFLVDAHEVWSADESGAGAVRSGLWRETATDGREIPFEATAVKTASRRLLLIQRAETQLADRTWVIQKARDHKLDTDRQLAERQKIQDLLEERVARRTAELTEANERLLREKHEREHAEERAVELRAALAHVGRLDVVGELASNLAHELNQPLSAITNYINGCLRLIEAEPSALDRVRDAMLKAAAQAERSGRIISRLRDFVAKGSPETVVTGLNGLVTEVVDLLEVELRRSGVRLELALAREGPTILVEPIQIQQVLANLVQNAIDAMRSQERDRNLVIITRPPAGGFAEVCVRDTGPGCSDDELARVFEPFFTTKEWGMGMGLAISRTIVTDHGGELLAERNPERGMSFRVLLPEHAEKRHDREG